ncbi:hypothetical protein CORC01_00507, partial [Colletotrichum orchidophilum]
PKSVYSRFKTFQQRALTATAVFCGFLAQVSRTTVLAAGPEIVATHHTTANVISISNTVFLTFTGLSAFIWRGLGLTFSAVALSVVPPQVQLGTSDYMSSLQHRTISCFYNWNGFGALTRAILPLQSFQCMLGDLNAHPRVYLCSINEKILN